MMVQEIRQKQGFLMIYFFGQTIVGKDARQAGVLRAQELI